MKPRHQPSLLPALMLLCSVLGLGLVLLLLKRPPESLAHVPDPEPSHRVKAIAVEDHSLRPESMAPSPTPTVDLSTVQQLIDNGRIDESAAILRDLQVDHPDNLAILLQRALLASRETSDYAGAQLLLENILRRDPNHLEAADELYRVYEKREDLEGAIAALQDLENRSSNAPQRGIDYSLGRVLLETGHAAEARPRLERALASDPDNAWIVREQLAATYMQLGERERARREWEALAQNEDAGYPALNAKARLAEVLREEGRLAEADALVRDVLERNPQHRLAGILSRN